MSSQYNPLVPVSIGIEQSNLDEARMKYATSEQLRQFTSKIERRFALACKRLWHAQGFTSSGPLVLRNFQHLQRYFRRHEKTSEFPGAPKNTVKDQIIFRV